MPRSHPSRWRSFLLGASVLLAACSSGGDDAAVASSTTAADGAGPSSVLEAAEASTTSTTTTTLPPIAFDYGVSDDVVRIGLSLDLTGPRADLSVLLLDAHSAHADRTNGAGGIGRRRVELVGVDHGSDLVQHLDSLEEFAERSENGVVIVGAIEGDEFAVASHDRLAESRLALVEIGLPDTAGTADVVATFGTPPCVSAAAAVQAAIGLELANVDATEDEDEDEDEVAEADGPNLAGPRVAIITGDSPADVDAVRGVRAAVARDGGQVVFSSSIDIEDIESSILELATAAPDIVWISAPPTRTAQLLLGSTVAGVDATWWGPFRGWDPAVLDTEAAAAFADRFSVVAPVQLNDSDALAELRRVLPESLWSDADQLLLGWYQAELVDAALIAAADAGDLGRGSVAEALTALDPQAVSTAFGDGREAFIYSVDASVDGLLALRQQGASALVRRTDLPDLARPISC